MRLLRFKFAFFSPFLLAVAALALGVGRVLALIIVPGRDLPISVGNASRAVTFGSVT